MSAAWQPYCGKSRTTISKTRPLTNGTMSTTEPCPGCGAPFPNEEGPVHRYMIGSAACWRRYGVVLGHEYSDLALSAIHRLSVDTYAVQHPGGRSRQAIQSVGLHLARLMVLLSSPVSPREANDVMLRLGKRKADLAYLERPATFSMTVADVVPFAGTARHSEQVELWARSTWQDWAAHHTYITTWAGAG